MANSFASVISGWVMASCRLASLEEFLSSLGVHENVIEYVSSITDKKTRGRLSNEIRKNPGMSLDQAKDVVSGLPRGRQPDEGELALIARAPDNIKDWYVRQVLKHRMAREQDGSWRHDPDIYSDVARNEISDWARQTGANLSSYSWEQARAASDEWHEEASAKGKGRQYEPLDEAKVAYGPTWKNPKWNGWTIQEVTSENDLMVEGNLMNHCVARYADDVAAGRSRIFSLRDPRNKPHVTMETDDQAKFFRQIMGNSNANPKKVYKDMIKEWVENMGGAMMEEGPDFDYVDLKYAMPRDMEDVLRSWFEYPNEYGLVPDPTQVNVQRAYGDILDQYANISTHGMYVWYMKGGAEAIADLAWAQINPELPGGTSYRDIGYLLQQIEKHDDEQIMYAPPQPDEDEFDDPAKFEEALKEWDDEFREQKEESLIGGFDKAMLDRLDEEARDRGFLSAWDAVDQWNQKMKDKKKRVAFWVRSMMKCANQEDDLLLPAKRHWKANKHYVIPEYREPLEHGRWFLLDGIPHLISAGGINVMHFVPRNKGKDISMGVGYATHAARNQGTKYYHEGETSVIPKTEGYYEKPDPNRVREFVNRRRLIRREYARRADENPKDEPGARMERDKAIRALEAEYQGVMGTKELNDEVRKQISSFFRKQKDEMV